MLAYDVTLKNISTLGKQPLFPTTLHNRQCTQIESPNSFSQDDTVIVTEGADPADGEGMLSISVL